MSNPMFQHRHYAAIAKVLADAREEERTIITLDRLEKRLADLFARDNGNFDRGRFELAARRDPKMHGKDKR